MWSAGVTELGQCSGFLSRGKRGVLHKGRLRAGRLEVRSRRSRSLGYPR